MSGRRVGLKGALGIERDEKIAGIDGYDAVRRGTMKLLAGARCSFLLKLGRKMRVKGAADAVEKLRGLWDFQRPWNSKAR